MLDPMVGNVPAVFVTQREEGRVWQESRGTMRELERKIPVCGFEMLYSIRLTRDHRGSV